MSLVKEGLVGKLAVPVSNRCQLICPTAKFTVLSNTLLVRVGLGMWWWPGSMCWNFFLLFLPSLSSPSSSLSLPPPPFLPHIFTPSLSLQEATVLRSSVSRNSGNPRLCLAHTHGQSILLLMNHLRSNKVKWRTENSVKVFCLSCYVSVQCAMTFLFCGWLSVRYYVPPSDLIM